MGAITKRVRAQTSGDLTRIVDDLFLLARADAGHLVAWDQVTLRAAKPTKPGRFAPNHQASSVDEVLVATGRLPNTEALPEGERPEWLHLVGDVSGEPALTHWGKYRARLLGARLRAEALGRPVPEAPDDVPVPQVIFTDPEVAAVGPTLAQAQADDPGAYALDVPIAAASGVGLLIDHPRGSARLVVGGDDRVLGATFVGPEVAELLHAATVAIVGRLTLRQLWHAVPSYPTASELWLRLLEQTLD